MKEFTDTEILAIGNDNVIMPERNIHKKKSTTGEIWNDCFDGVAFQGKYDPILSCCTVDASVDGSTWILNVDYSPGIIDTA